jgi:hypothetical protein
MDGDRVDTPEKLEEWLLSLPHETETEKARFREVARTVAFRAAARVWPVVSRKAPYERDRLGSSGKVSACVSFWALAVSSISAVRRTEETARAVSDVAHRFGRALYATGVAADAALAAARAVSSANTVAAAAANSASTTIAAALSVARPTRAALAVDVAVLQLGDSLSTAPLWLDPNAAPDLWSEARAIFAAAPEDWSPVIAWYDHLLDPRGRALDLDMLEEIATIPAETWDAGPATALPEIGKIWNRYYLAVPTGDAEVEPTAIAEVLERTNDGVVVTYDPARDRFAQKDVAAENARRLAHVVAKLSEVIALIGDQRGDLRGVLKNEMFLLCRAVEHHATNPVMVHANASNASKMLAMSIVSGGCPSETEEPVIGVLQACLLETVSTLRDEPEVREASGRPPLGEAILSDAAAMEVLEAATVELATAAEGSLAEELAQDLRHARDPFLPVEMQGQAAARLANRVFQTWVITRWKRFVDFANAAEKDLRTVAELVKHSLAITAAVGGLYLAISNSAVIGSAVTAIIRLVGS